MAPVWQPAFNLTDVRLEQDEPLYQGFFRLHRLTLSHPRFEGGRVRIQRELLDRGDAVCVLLYDPTRDAVVLVEQFRAGALTKTDAPWWPVLSSRASLPRMWRGVKAWKKPASNWVN
jgi:ADP-ribose pyrophosphatase